MSDLLAGIDYPANGRRIYKENLDYEQEAKGQAIIDRTADFLSHGVQSGGDVSVAGASLISIGATVAIDDEGRRIVVPSGQQVNASAGSWAVVLRHVFSATPGNTPDLSGQAVQHRSDSFEVLLRASVQAGDVPLRAITVAAGVVTLGADLRQKRNMTMSGDQSVEGSSSVGGTLDVQGVATFRSGIQIFGSLTNIETLNQQIKDNIIDINYGETGAGVSGRYAGHRVKRGTLSDVRIVFDEQDDRWKAGIEGSEEILASLSEVYTRAQLEAFFEGFAAGKLQVDWTRLTNKPSLYTQSEIQSFFAGLVAGKMQIDWSNVINAPANVILRGYIDGLITKPNATNPLYQIDTAPGLIADSTGAHYLVLSASLTKSLNAAWAVGNNNGGLDTGAIAANTWYYEYMIKRADTGVVDAIWSASSSAPQMPANYALRSAPVAAVLTDATGNIIAYIQIGDEFWFTDVRIPIDGANISTAGALYTLAGPNGIGTEAICVGSSGLPVQGVLLAISVNSPGVNYQVPAATPEDSAFRGLMGAYAATGQQFLYSHATYFRIPTDPSGRVKMRRTSGSYYGTAYQTTVQQWGFIMSRGRNV